MRFIVALGLLVALVPGVGCKRKAKATAAPTPVAAADDTERDDDRPPPLDGFQPRVRGTMPPIASLPQGMTVGTRWALPPAKDALTWLPITANLPAGMTRQLPDPVNLRSLLFAKNFERLNAVFSEVDQECAKDPAKEYWMAAALAAFESPDADLHQAIEDWRLAAPDSPFPLMAQSAFYTQLGWWGRGHAFAKKTSDEKFAQFYGWLNHAQRVLRPVLARPHIPCMARAVELGFTQHLEGSAAMERVYATATQECPDCPVEKKLVLGFRDSRWGGKRASAVAMAEEVKGRLAGRPWLLPFTAAPLAWDCDDADLRDVWDDACDRAVAVAPWSQMLLEGRAQALWSQDRFEEGLRDEESMVAVVPYRGGVWAGRGYMLWNLKRRAEAEKSYRQALLLEVDPNVTKAARQLFSKSARAKATDARGRADWTACIVEATYALAFEDGVDARVLRAQCLAETHRPQPARADIASALQMAPNDPDALAAQAALDLEGKAPQEVLDYWNKRVAKDSSDARALLGRAQTYLKLKNFDAAGKDAERACSLGLSQACPQAVSADHPAGR